MNTYKYSALNDSGQLIKGELRAESADDLDRMLRDSCLDLLACKVKRRLISKAPVSRTELVQFLFYLRQLLEAGVPLIDALKDIEETAAGSELKTVLACCVRDVEGGRSFSSSIARYPESFPDVMVSMLVVGEETGNIPQVLKELIESIKWQEALSKRIRKVITYPLLVSVVLSAVIFFLMTYLVPNLLVFIKSTSYQLPWYTHALLASSDHLRAYGHYYFITIITTPLVMSLLIRHSQEVREICDSVLLRIPWVGPLVFKIKVARFSHFTSLMYAAGIPFITAIEKAKALTSNTTLERAIGESSENIANGMGIYNAFQHSELFPLLVLRMLKCGEISGSLDRSLAQISEFYNDDVEQAISRFEQLMGPLLISVVGLLLVWVVVAVIGPMYDAVFAVGASM